MSSQEHAAGGMSIKETADLYGITNSTLYYYEQIGLLVPERNPENRYRMYKDVDFAHLNMIRTLQNMGISLEHIKEFEHDHTMAKSLSLLFDELQKIESAITELNDRHRRVEAAIRRYTLALLDAPSETIIDAHEPERPYLSGLDEIAQPSNYPLVYAQRMREVGIDLNVFNMLPVFEVEPQVNEHNIFTAKRFMMFAEEPLGVEDGAFPAGRYLTVTFRGSVEETPRVYAGVREYMATHGLRPVANPIEFWVINEYTSDNDEEFAHVLQQQVEEDPQSR